MTSIDLNRQIEKSVKTYWEEEKKIFLGKI